MLPLAFPTSTKGCKGSCESSLDSEDERKQYRSRGRTITDNNILHQETRNGTVPGREYNFHTVTQAFNHSVFTTCYARSCQLHVAPSYTIMGKCKGLQKQSGPAKEHWKSSNQQQQHQQQQQQQQPRKVRPQVIHGDLYQRATFTFQASAFLQQLQSQPVTQSKRPKSAEKLVEDGNEGPAKKEPCDFSRLSRNIMAANRKMVIHNQMKL